MTYSAEDFIENDNYYSSGDYERISNFSISNNLLSPPVQFSEEAATVWKKEVELACERLNGQLAFLPDYPESPDDYKSIAGPFDIELDYIKDKRLFSFKVTSTLTGAERVFEVAGKDINQIANDYRETFLTKDFHRAIALAADKPSVLAQMDQMRKGHHATAAKRLMAAVNDAGLDCRYLDFCKDLFTLIQVVAPMPSQLAIQMNGTYEPKFV